MFFGQAADFDLAAVASPLDVYNQATVDIRLLLSVVGPYNYQFTDIVGIGYIGPVNISPIVSFIRPDDDVAGNGRIVLTGGIAAYSKDPDGI